MVNSWLKSGSCRIDTVVSACCCAQNAASASGDHLKSSLHNNAVSGTVVLDETAVGAYQSKEGVHHVRRPLQHSMHVLSVYGDGDC
jgi:hypothetical protein